MITINTTTIMVVIHCWLMMDMEILSITDWVDSLASDHLLALMIGLPSNQLPPLGSYDLGVLYPPIPRGTPQYKETYSQRTCSERINNRILNDYHLLL